MAEQTRLDAIVTISDQYYAGLITWNEYQTRLVLIISRMDEWELSEIAEALRS